VPDGEKPNGEKSPAGRKADPIARVTEILGVVAGSAALVYVTGGAIYLARLAFYDVPALTVVSSLPREFLISVGLLALGIPALVGACLYICLARWLYESKDRWFLAPWLLVAVTVCLAVVYVLIEADSSPSPQVVAGIMVVATILFAAIALLGTVINRYWEKDALWHRAALYGFALVPAGLTLSAGLPLQRAAVCVAKSDSITGRFLGQSDERVWLAEVIDRPDSSTARIVAIPSSATTGVFVYDAADPPACPESS